MHSPNNTQTMSLERQNNFLMNRSPFSSSSSTLLSSSSTTTSLPLIATTSLCRSSSQIFDNYFGNSSSSDSSPITSNDGDDRDDESTIPITTSSIIISNNHDAIPPPPPPRVAKPLPSIPKFQNHQQHHLTPTNSPTLQQQQQISLTSPATHSPPSIIVSCSHHNRHITDPMQASTWIKGLQMFMDDSRGVLSASSVARTTNRNALPESQTANVVEENGSSVNKKMHKKHSSFGESIRQKLKVSSKASTGTEVADALGNDEYMSSPNSGFSPKSPGNAKPLPFPIKKESHSPLLLTPTISTETSSSSNEIAKQLQKLKKTPATPTSNSNNTNLEVKNDSNAQTNEDKQLFEVVVVVKLRKKDDKLEPFIHYEFPPQTGRSSKSQQIINSVPLFCCKLSLFIIVDINIVISNSS